MPRPATLLVVCLAVLTSLVVGCGGDSTSPENDGPASFARMIGSTPAHETPITGVAVMSDGTRMVSGIFKGSLHVSGATDSIISGGNDRAFLASFRPDGSVASMTSVGGGAVAMRRMARDRDDNLLFVGSFGGTSNFANVSLTAVNGDMIFAKLDRNGNAEWVQSGSGTGPDFGKDITSASDGTIYVSGDCNSEMTVGGEDVGQTGHETGFLVKLRSDGVGIWQQTGGVTAGGSQCDGVAISADGSVVVCGFYNVGSMDFAGDILTPDGSFDGFIGRFGADGTPMGAIKIGGPDLAEATDVTTLDNDVVVTGTFAGSADFNVSESGDDLTANGNLNAFVARYTEAGALRWVKTFGPGDNQIGETISRLSDGNILVCGTFMTTITLGSTTLTSAGNVDVFFARLDGSGHVVSAGRVGGDQEDLTPLATTSGTTAIIVGGSASDDLVFPGGIHRKKIGSFDGFILQQP